MSDLMPTITYGGDDEDEFGGATFARTCPKCGRFIKADATVTLDWQGQPVKGESNATCSQCGRVEMDFVGYY